MRPSWLGLGVWLSTLGVGCYGFGGDDTPPDPTIHSTPSPLTCDPTAKPPVAGLRRLTTAQYRNTLRDLTTFLVGDATAAATLLDGIGSMADLPTDEPEKTNEDVKGSYRRLDQTLQQDRVDAYYAVGIDLGKALTRGTNLGKVVGTCATDSNTTNDGGCIDSFIRKIAPKVLRRPVTDADVTFLTGVYGKSTVQSADAYADVIGVLLNMPEFLYFVEHGTLGVNGDANELVLGPYELASRLSYQLWDTMPDDALFAAAADGSILTDSGYAAQVDRMLADARVKTTMDDFFRDWIKSDELPELDLRNGDALFKSFAGENLPSKNLRSAMIADVVDTIDWITWRKKGGIQALFTTEDAVNSDPELAKIYGVGPWNGQGSPPTFTARPGIFTHAMFLTSGSANTRPIMKGAFLRKAILCDELNPPDGAMFQTPDLQPDMTTREVIEQLTEKSGTVCAGCHQYQINPLGFTTEGFDSLGRARTVQTLFDDKGTVLGKKAIRTDTIPYVEGGDKRPAAGPRETMQLLAESPKASACFARNYFRFTAAHWETKGDGCAVKRYDEALRHGGIADVFRAAVMDPTFRRRMFDPKP